MPQPLRPGRPARGRSRYTKPRPRSLHTGSHSAPRRPASRPGHAQRPAHLQPLANACSTLAACCCCCHRPAIPPSHPPPGERLRGLENASGPSPYEYYRNRAFGPPRGLHPSHTARCEPLVCHRVYSPEVALRQRMSAKYIHTFRRIGSSLPAATSRASRASLPMHVRPRTYAVSLPTTSCTAL